MNASTTTARPADTPAPTAGEVQTAVPALRLAYLTTEYPKASHTFIRREILELERRGMLVERLSIRDSGGAIADEADRREQQRTFICLHQPKLRFAMAVLRCAVTHPGRFLRALRTTLTMGRRSDRGVLRHLAYLAETCVLLRVTSRRSIDHVHVHFGTNAAAVARLMRILGGPTYSMTVHGPDEFDAPRGFSLGDKVVDAEFVCAISAFCAAQLQRWTPYEHWSKISIVHCSVDESFLDTPTPINRSSNMFLSIGRLSAQKGQLLLIEAIASLIAGGTDVRLVLAGDGEMRPEIERCVREMNLAEHVTITGYVDEQRIRDLIGECRALVQPSFAEGLPVVIMEALAMGRPVIASCINGIPELVKRAENGWLITPGSVMQIADAIGEVLRTDTDRLFEMGLDGRERVMAEHRCSTEVDKLVALLRRVADSRRSASEQT